jgi:hypothetical protein
VVLFRLRDDLAGERRDAFHAAVGGLVAIPDVAGLAAGPALHLQPGYDYVLMVDVEDAAAFARYKDHPIHRRLVEEHIRPCVEETVRAQITV